jgi:hypothetical protein
VQAPFWQVAPLVHAVHAVAKMPHAWLVLPNWHTLLESQQPSQLDLKHDAVDVPHDGMRAAQSPTAAPRANAFQNIGVLNLPKKNRQKSTVRACGATRCLLLDAE